MKMTAKQSDVYLFALQELFFEERAISDLRERHRNSRNRLIFRVN